MQSPSSSRPTSPTASEHPSIHFPSPSQPRPFRFDWEGSKSRGPGSVVSDANESRLDFAANDVNVGPATSAYGSHEISDFHSSSFSPEWSSSSQGFNAISTILNNPRKKSVPLKPSRAPIPASQSSDLPRVRRKDFDAYIKAIGPEWEKFHRITQLGIQSPPSIRDGSITLAQQPPFSLKGKSRQVPPLSSVPAVFFDPAFNLGNPRIFASVTEQDLAPSVDSSPLNPEDISLNQVLQEKLSHYMDVVEQHLTQEIQSRSTSFFAALSNLQDLQTEGADCLERINKLRLQLQQVDTRVARKGLLVVRLQRRRANIQAVQDALTTIKEVRDMLQMCDRLVSEGNWDEALGLISLLEDFSRSSSSDNGNIDQAENNPSSPSAQVNGRFEPSHFRLTSLSSPSPSSSQFRPKSPTPTSDAPPVSPLPRSSSFSNAVVLSSLPTQLHTLLSRISDSLSRSLVDALRDDLSTRFALAPSEGDITCINDKFRQRISPLWQGLSRTAGVHDMLTRYRDMVLSEVRVCVRRSLPHKLDMEDEDEVEAPSTSTKKLSERSAALTKGLRALTQPQFLALSKSMYAGLLRCLEGIAEHAKLFDSFDPPKTEGPQSSSRQSHESVLAEVLSASTELANIRVSKVVLVRAEQHSQLELAEFLEFFNESWSFVVKCEVMARKMIVGLRGAIISQAKAFLSNFHAVRLSASATLVENEVWGQVEVPPQSQRWADLLVASAMGDPPEFILTSPAQSNGNGSDSSTQEPSNEKLMQIDGRPFFVVGATLKVIEMLIDYLKVIMNLSLLTTDTMSRTIEYLKSFNSRTCQVVLGAGAMRSAGLKNITAKHLALASQSLSVMIAFIPYVRETFRRHLNPKQAVMLIEFDKLKRDYHDHQSEIHSKLIAIMGDRLSAHCKSLHAVDWESSAPAPGPNTYMELLIKETLTLHKVLSKYLGSQAVEFVMSQVFAAINHRLSEEYGKIDLPNQAAKDRLLEDARYLHQKLTGLKDIGAPSAMLETVVKEKPVRQPRRGSLLFSRKGSGSHPTPPVPTSPEVPLKTEENGSPRSERTSGFGEVVPNGEAEEGRATGEDKGEVPVGRELETDGIAEG